MMKEYINNRGNQSRILNSNPRVCRQASISEILQTNGVAGRERKHLEENGGIVLLLYSILIKWFSRTAFINFMDWYTPPLKFINPYPKRMVGNLFIPYSPDL